MELLFFITRLFSMVPPPQTHSPLDATVLGTIGTVLWCVQLIPQIWQNWRTKCTEGLPISMMILWSAGGPPLGVYCVVQNFNIPVQVQPQVFTALTLVINAQILIYYHKWSTWRATALMGGLAVFLGGFELVLILVLKMAYQRGIQAPTIAMGTLTVVLLILGFVPLYKDMAKRKGQVVGINFVFLFLDSAGAIFSLASLALQDQFDILGGFNYISILLAEIIVFTSHLIWRMRFKTLHSDPAQSQVDSDCNIAKDEVVQKQTDIETNGPVMQEKNVLGHERKLSKDNNKASYGTIVTREV